MDKKWHKMTKYSASCTLYIRKHISYDLHLWYTCMYKRKICPGSFFHYFKILIFIIIWGVRGQKMAQNDKKIIFVTSYISGTIKHMMFIYGTHRPFQERHSITHAHGFTCAQVFRRVINYTSKWNFWLQIFFLHNCLCLIKIWGRIIRA